MDETSVPTTLPDDEAAGAAGGGSKTSDVIEAFQWRADDNMVALRFRSGLVRGFSGSSPVRTLRTMGNGGQSGWSWTRALHRLRGRRASVPEEALIIKAARLAVATRLASRTLFVRHLEVSDEEADQLLARLEHCGVIASEEPGRTRSVLTTPGELPDVIAEFTRRS